MNRLPRLQQGFTLIEVMIVFFVLSVGLLGMAALQMKSMQYNQGSYIRSQATIAAYDILDRMRVNKTAADGNSYNIDFGDPAPTGSTVAEEDLAEWKNFLSVSLPSGDGQVFCSAGQCVIEIEWVDRATGATITPPLAVTAQMQ